MDEIGRKRLPHDPPLGIGAGGQVFFLTICATDRAGQPLTRSSVPEILLEAAHHRRERGMWHVHIFLIMPDHVHALVAIPLEGSLRRPVADWKRWTAMRGGLAWQRDFSAIGCAAGSPRAKRRIISCKILFGLVW